MTLLSERGAEVEYHDPYVPAIKPRFAIDRMVFRSFDGSIHGPLRGPQSQDVSAFEIELISWRGVGGGYRA